VDPGVLQDRVEGCGELPGPVTDQEQEPRGAVTEVLYRSITCRRCCELRFGPMGRLRQDRGSCAFGCCT